MTDTDREIARKRLKGRRDFAATCGTLAIVAVFLVVIWFVTTGGHGYFWPVWPLIGFAIAILFSGLNAYGVLNREVTDDDIEGELERMRRKP